jgi:A/G-specific adenine glycosylase
MLWNVKQNYRAMPWKGEKNAYKIWLSEIILQQTRVEQGLKYYEAFVSAFPTIEALAKAPETKVFKLWEGLGYYTRCKNLIHTAKYVTQQYNGVFPTTYESILELKGIGPYTAAAIASFAYNLPYAVIDGNVYRVLARFFGNALPIDSAVGKKEFATLAQALLDKKKPGHYNQAIMDFGATVCKPKLPLCTDCVLQKKCVAYNTNSVNQFPVKEKKITKKIRWINYLIVEQDKKIFVRKRTENDIWQALYEFIEVPFEGEIDWTNMKTTTWAKAIFGKTLFEIVCISKVYKQQLTHQTILGQFVQISIAGNVQINGYNAVKKSKMNLLPFSKFITNYLQDKNVSLNLF